MPSHDYAIAGQSTASTRSHRFGLRSPQAKSFCQYLKRTLHYTLRLLAQGARGNPQLSSTDPERVFQPAMSTAGPSDSRQQSKSSRCAYLYFEDEPVRLPIGVAAVHSKIAKGRQ